MEDCPLTVERTSFSETQESALAWELRRNGRRIKSFTRFFSKNRGNGRGRAPSQVLSYRTSEADHSFATDHEACAALGKYSKKTFSTNRAPLKGALLCLETEIDFRESLIFHLTIPPKAVIIKKNKLVSGGQPGTHPVPGGQSHPAFFIGGSLSWTTVERGFCPS